MSEPCTEPGRHRSEAQATPERIVGYVALGFVGVILIECIVGAGWLRIISTIADAAVVMFLLRSVLRIVSYGQVTDEEVDDDVPVDTDDKQGHGAP